MIAKSDRNRIIVLNYGPGKVGKTYVFIKMLLEHEDLKAIIFSFDAGLVMLKRMLKDEKHSSLKKRILIFEPDDNSNIPILHQLREDVAYVQKVLEKSSTVKENIWIALDTVTDMQIRLLTDARRIQMGQQSASYKADPVREALTQVDYNVNLGQAYEAIGMILNLQCNVYMTALEKVEREGLGDRTKYHPAIAGQQVYHYIVGKADAILRMVRDQEGNRLFQVRATPLAEAGCRIDFDEDKVEPDLYKVWRHIVG